MNTKQLSGKVLLALLLILGIAACQQDPGETPQLIEPVTYETSIDEIPELRSFIGKFLGTSKRSTENIPEVNGGDHYSDLVDKIDFNYILARMDTSGQTYMSMSIANEDPKVIQNLVIGKGINQNLLTPMIFTYTMDVNFYEVYKETGSLAGFSGQFERVNLTPYAYEQNESAANIAQFRSSTSTDCPDKTTMEPKAPEGPGTGSGQVGSSGGGGGTSACTYELVLMPPGENTSDNDGVTVRPDYWYYMQVLVCPDNLSEQSSSDSNCDNPNNGEVPIVIDILKLFEDQIDDSSLDPCLKNILSDLKTLKFDLSWVLNRFNLDPQFPPIDWISNYNWELVSVSSNGNENATTILPYDFNEMRITSTFNRMMLSETSDLSAARTILHEMVHAFLAAEWSINRRGRNGLQMSYPEYWFDRTTNNGAFNTMNEVQHKAFYDSFLDDMALSLQNFGKSKGYNHDLSFYKKLSWGGLTHWDNTDDGIDNPTLTPWFLEEFPSASERKAVLDIIEIEQFGRDTNGSAKAQKGDESGC